MLTADDASVLRALKRAARNNRPLKTFTQLADLHVAVKQAEPIPSHTKSAFGARLYTSYLEGSTIAVTGSVCRSVHNHTDTQWLFDNSG